VCNILSYNKLANFLLLSRSWCCGWPSNSYAFICCYVLLHDQKSFSSMLLAFLGVVAVPLECLLLTRPSCCQLLISLPCLSFSSGSLYAVLSLFLTVDFRFLLLLYSTLLYLLSLMFHCVERCWDRTQDRCNLGVRHSKPSAGSLPLFLLCFSC
jgi:hypothetical protein